jgi:hypothetical protein
MPLSEPAPREHMHLRDIQVWGYHRADGLFDIEGRLTDTKPYAFDGDAGKHMAAGQPLHMMWMRLTIDEHMKIVAAEAVTDHGPFENCGGGAASYAGLVGLTIRPGFLRAANERIGGTAGCTHIREMLQQMATTAFQTMWPVRSRSKAKAVETEAPDAKAAEARMLNTCFAYSSDSPVVRRRWPHLYTGPEAVT